MRRENCWLKRSVHVSKACITKRQRRTHRLKVPAKQALVARSQAQPQLDAPLQEFDGLTAEKSHQLPEGEHARPRSLKQDRLRSQRCRHTHADYPEADRVLVHLTADNQLSRLQPHWPPFWLSKPASQAWQLQPTLQAVASRSQLFKVARRVALDQNGHSKTLHADPPTHRNKSDCAVHTAALCLPLQQVSPCSRPCPDLRATLEKLARCVRSNPSQHVSPCFVDPNLSNLLQCSPGFAEWKLAGRQSDQVTCKSRLSNHATTLLRMLFLLHLSYRHDKKLVNSIA